MKTTNLLEGVQFDARESHAEPLYVDQNGRVIRFSLKPGQSIRAHRVPDSPFYIIVLKGTGIFSGNDGKEQSLGVNSLLVFAPNENHSIRALSEELVFVGILYGEESNVSQRVGGTMTHAG